MVLMKRAIRIFKVIFISLLSIFLFTGCWDKVEPEERGFVTAMGIDKTNSSLFNICVEVPSPEAFQEDSGGGEEKKEEGEESENSYTESYKGNSVWSAVKSIDGKIDRKLNFGQIKLCVFGEDILKDREMFKQAVDALERSKEVGRKVLICSAKEDAEEILKGYTGDRKTAGLFVTAFFNNNRKNTDITLKKSLQDMLVQLSSTGNTVLPIIGIDNGELYFSGMSVIKDYVLSGYVENDIMKGYVIVKEDIMETDITTKLNGVDVPLKVTKKNTDIKFSEENNKVKCIINVDIEGSVEEYRNGAVPIGELEKAYKNTVSESIKNTFDFFKYNLNTDVFELQEYCRKKENDLYKKFGKDKLFDNMELSENINIVINGTGTIN